jgi:hypothetical protein
MTIKDINPTTRMYPRTLREAFPHSHTDCIEHYVKPSNDKTVVYILLAFAIMCFLIAKAI